LNDLVKKNILITQINYSNNVKDLMNLPTEIVLETLADVFRGNLFFAKGNADQCIHLLQKIV